MGGWDQLGAAIGGAAGGATQAMQFEKSQQRQRDLAELRSMLALVAEQGRNTRADASDLTRRRGQDLATDKADADRALKTTQVTDAMTRGWEKLGQDYELGSRRLDLTEQGQDNQEGRFWGGTMPLAYDSLGTRDATTRRGQNLSLEGRKYAADTAAETSTANAGTRDAAARTNTRAKTVLDVLKMKQKGAGVFGGTSATDWADEFDSLYNDPDKLAREAVAAGVTPDDTAAVPAAKPAVPVAPRGAGGTAGPDAMPASVPAAAPASTPAAAGGPKTVTLADLQRVAKLRGTTVDAQKQRAIAEGYRIVP